MKKLAFLMAVMMMFTLLLAGCNNTTTSSAPESKPADNSGAESTPADGDDPYANIDLSKEENIVMYVTATEPNAIKEVMEAANEKIKAAINTTIDLYFIPSACLLYTSEKNHCSGAGCNDADDIVAQRLW